MLCPCCERNGRISYIRTLQVGFDEALQLCEQADCTYPELGDDVPLLVSRNVKDSIAADIANFVDLRKHASASETLASRNAVKCGDKTAVSQLLVTDDARSSVTSSTRRSQSEKLVKQRKSSDSNVIKSKSSTRKREATSTQSSSSNVKISELFGDLDEPEFEETSRMQVADSINKNVSKSRTPLVQANENFSAKRARVTQSVQSETNASLFSRPRALDTDCVHPQFINSGDSCWFDAALSFFVHADFSDHSSFVNDLRDQYSSVRQSLRAALDAHSRAGSPSSDFSASTVTLNVNANVQVALPRDSVETLQRRLDRLRDSTLSRCQPPSQVELKSVSEAFEWLATAAYPDSHQSPFMTRFSRRSQCNLCAYCVESEEHNSTVLALPNFGVKGNEKCSFPRGISSFSRCPKCSSADGLRCDTNILRLGTFLAVRFQDPGVFITSSSLSDSLAFEWQDGSARFMYHIVAVLQLRPKPDHYICWIRDRIKEKWMECDDLKGLCTCFNRLQPACPSEHVCMVVWQRDRSPLPNLGQSTAVSRVEHPISSCNLGDADDFLTASGAVTDSAPAQVINERPAAAKKDVSMLTWLRDTPLLAAARNKKYTSVVKPRSSDVSPATSSSSVGSQLGSTSSGYVSVCGSTVSCSSRDAAAASAISKVSLVCDLLKERGVPVRFEKSSRAFPSYKPTAAAQQPIANMANLSSCVAAAVPVSVPQGDLTPSTNEKSDTVLKSNNNNDVGEPAVTKCSLPVEPPSNHKDEFSQLDLCFTDEDLLDLMNF